MFFARIQKKTEYNDEVVSGVDIRNNCNFKGIWYHYLKIKSSDRTFFKKKWNSRQEIDPSRFPLDATVPQF